MIDKSKPWLAAKTAGEALRQALILDDGRPKPCYAIAYYEASAQAVIEWHEAQREKVGEYWRVEYQDALHTWDRNVEHKGPAIDEAKMNRKRFPHLSCKVIHVTRYQRKR